MSPPRVRSVLLALASALLSVVLSATTVSSASAAPATEFLLVADPGADAVHILTTPGLRRSGTLDDVRLSQHAGTTQLPDGRLIFVDDKHRTVNALQVSANGRPRIVARARIPGDAAAFGEAAWAAVDPSLRYFVVSGAADGPSTSVTVVELRTFAVHQVQVPTGPDSSGQIAETQVYFAGSPLQLVVTSAGRFQTMPLAPILKGKTPAVTSTAPVGPYNHGPVVRRDGEAVYSTTADGFSGATITGSKLRSPRTVAYSSTRNLVEVWRPRLAGDRRTVWGVAAEDTGLAPADWADTRNDVVLFDTVRFTPRLVRVPDGLTSRLALSDRYAAVASVHPEGDALTLLDSNRRSPTYGRIVGTVALPTPTGAPVGGMPAPDDAEGHFVTIDRGGNRAYVSHGGDGQVSVVNLKSRRLTNTVDVPTPLTGAGYLRVLRRGTPVDDLIAR